MIGRISVSVITKNEAANMARCLSALKVFDDVRVIDSASTDGTADIARAMGAQVTDFTWNRCYPKKKQWSVDYLEGLRDYVLHLDADEVMTPELAAEIAAIEVPVAGYYVPGRYVFEGRALGFGLRNTKLALFDRRRMRFPVVDDLDIEGGNEVEGHYQPHFIRHCEPPAKKSSVQDCYVGFQPPRDDGFECIKTLRNPLLHYGYNDHWEARHQRYAKWQVGVESRGALPEDGRFVKRVFLALPCKPLIAFLHSYILRGGFLDGAAGFRFAISRARYYRMVQREKIQRTV